MGWQNVVAEIFRAGNQVVINRQGFFIYNGPPALGNLIVSAAPAAGIDPKGNAFPQGLSVTVGAITGTSFQTTSLSPGVKIDTSGDIIVFNTHGAIILYISPSKDGLYVYKDTGSATQGALTASIAGLTETDPVNGTSVLQGIQSTNTATNQIVQLVDGSINLGLSTNNALAAIQTPTGGLDVAAAQFTQGKVTNTDQRASIALFRVSAGGQPVIQFENVDSASTPGIPILIPAMPTGVTPAAVSETAVLFSDQNDTGVLRYIAGSSAGGFGDGNINAIGALTQSLSGTQLISSTTPVVITNMNFNVATGNRYRLDMMLTWTGVGATGNAVFGFDGSNTSTQQSVFFWTGTGTPTDGTSTGGNITSPTLTTSRQGLWYTALIVCTVAGTFNVRAQITSGGSNFNMNNSYCTLMPL